MAIIQSGITPDLLTVDPVSKAARVTLYNPDGYLSTSAGTTANQGTPNSLSNAWTTKVTDGYDVLGTATHPLRIDPVGTTTQPISGTVTANVGTTGGLALDATLTGGTQRTKITDGTNNAVVSAAGAIKIDGSAVTQPVSGTVSATQSGTWTVQPGNTANTTPWLATLNQGGNSATVTAGNALKVDGSAVTQPVSGTVTSNIGTTNGLALDATLTGGTQTTRLTDGTNTATVKAASTAAVVADKALVVAVSPNNTVAITASSLPLPTGAATETTLSTRLADSTFTGRINTLGQKTMANSTPVVLASDQTVIPISDNSGSITVDGTIAATQSGTWTVQPGNTANTTPWLTTISQGGNAATVTAGNALKIDGSAVTQPVSGTVTANVGTTGGLALDATLTGGTQTTRITDGTNTASVKAASTAAGATDKAVVVAVSPNNSVAITAAALPLPSGAATEATLSTRLADSTFTGRINTLGQKTMANSTPVVLSSDQTVIPVSDNAGSLTIDNSTLSVVGGGTEATALRVTIASDSTGLLSVDDGGGSLTIDGTVAATQSGTWTVQPGNTANTTPWLTTISQGGNAASVSASNALKVDGSAVTQPVSAPTLTKGTQGANGFSVQDLKDAGRVIKTYSASAVTGSTSEALVTLTPYADLVAGSTGTSFAVTASKRLRLQTMIVTWRNNTNAAGGVTVRFRTNAGTVIVSSPVQFAVNATTSLATTGSGTTSTVIFPDGFELSGTMQFGVTQIAVGAVVGFDISVIGYEY